MTASPNFTSNVAAFRESHWTHLLFTLLRSTVWPVIDSCSVGRCMSTEGLNVICSKPCKWSLGSSSRIARSLIEIHHEGFPYSPLKAPLKVRAEFGRETKLCMLFTHLRYCSLSVKPFALSRHTRPWRLIVLLACCNQAQARTAPSVHQTITTKLLPAFTKLDQQVNWRTVIASPS